MALPKSDDEAHFEETEQFEDDTDDDVIIISAHVSKQKIKDEPLSDTELNQAALSSDSAELPPLNRLLDTTNPANFNSYLNIQSNETLSPLSMLKDNVESLRETSTVAENKPEKSALRGKDKIILTNKTEEDVARDIALANQNSNLTGDKDADIFGSGKRKRNSYSDSPHKLQCPYCPRAFPWISSLKRHILTHTGQKPFKCPECAVTFSTKSNRERHMYRKHGLDVHDPAVRRSMDRPYKCHICASSSFASASCLEKHFKEQHPDESLPGTVAEQARLENPFASESSSTNKTDKEEVAEQNEMMSEDRNSSVADFDDEEEYDGQSEAVFDDSGIVQMANDSLMEQTTALAEATLSPYPESPANSETLPHVNPERDNYNVDKITKCWKCGDRFTARKELLRHLKEHNIDNPFKCYLCDASFEDRQESLQHLIDEHASDWEMLREKNNVKDLKEFSDGVEKIVDMNLKIGPSGTAEVRTTRSKSTSCKVTEESDYAQRKVYCSLCAKRFWSLQDLRRHMRSHTGERPFACDICGKRFTLKHSMMRHRRKHSNTEGGYSGSEDEDEQVHFKALANNNDNNNELDADEMREDAEDSGNQSNLLNSLLGVDKDQMDELLNSTGDAADILGMK